MHREEFTARELDILEGLALGETNKQIAERLILSTETVRWYARQIYSKLNVNNRTQASIRARELGLLDNPAPQADPHQAHARSTKPVKLPVYYSSFVGRKREFTELTALIEDPKVRLLTIVGSGGIGKTRLAVEVVNQIAHQFPDGVFFIPLDDTITDDEVFLLRLRRTLDLNSRGNLFDELRDRHTLLLFDNFEQSLAQRKYISQLLTVMPRVMIVITSQVSLNLSQEWVRRIGNLIDPDQTGETMLDDAIQLFMDRVRQVQINLSLDTHYPCISEICQLVQGMPLAIELAAIWLKTVACEDILNELARNLDILEVTAGDIATRHQSLKAVFEHTWRLLPETEQRVFKRLAVFRGEFGLEAARQVAGANLSTLASLVDWSLIHQTRRGRYRMHRLLRQYAEEKLVSQQHGLQSDIAFMVMSLMKGEFQQVEQIAGQLLAESSDEMNLDKGLSLAVMGTIAGAREDYDQCLQLCEASIALNIDDPIAVFFSYLGLSIGYMGMGDTLSARAALHRFAPCIESFQSAGFVLLCLPVIARITTHEGYLEITAQILGLLDRHEDKLPDWMTEWARLIQLHAMLKDELGHEAFDYNWQQGQIADPYDLANSAITEHLAVDILQMSDSKP
jgi:predicted ATPase/DNA-binding CsgD family transcriptional regulator